MKINILGTEYEILKQTEEENPKLEEANGICELYSKKIILRNIPDDKMNFENMVAFNHKILRHEIIHAFFAESGLRSNSDFAENEDKITYCIGKHWGLTIGHHDWGNDSCDSVESYDICSAECLEKELQKYVQRDGTAFFEVGCKDYDRKEEK